MWKVGLLLVGILCLPIPAYAQAAIGYIGPGAGLGTLGALFAVVCMVLLGLLGPILYPIRLFLRWYRRRNQNQDVQDSAEANSIVAQGPPPK